MSRFFTGLSVFALSLLLSLVVLMASSTEAPAQTSIFDTYNDAAYKAFQSGDLDTSEKMYTAALAQAQAFGQADPRYIKCLEGLAILQAQRRDFATAEAGFQKVMALKEQLYGANSPDVLVTMCYIADAFMDQCKFLEADLLYRKVVQSMEKKYPLYSQALHNFGNCCLEEAHYDEADDCFARAQALDREQYGATSEQVARDTVSRAEVCRERGNFSAAEKFANDAVDLLKDRDSENGSKNFALGTLAMIYLDQGKYAKAQELAKQVLHNFEGTSSSDAIEVTQCFLCVAEVLRQRHKYEDAVPFINQARVALEKEGKSSPLLASVFRKFGDIYVDQGKYGEAEASYLKAKAMAEESLGKDHPDVARILARLAYLYGQQSKWLEAEADFRRAMFIEGKTVGKSHPAYALDAYNFGQMFNSEHKQAEAERYLTEALKIREHILPPEHPDLAKSLNALAGFYRDNNAPARAEDLYRKLLARDEKYSDSKADKACDLSNLASILLAQGKEQDAQRLLDQSSVLKQGLPGASSEKTAPDTFKNKSGIKDRITGQKWCLCIGISNFKDSSINLKYAAKDATDFRNFMVTNGNFRVDHTRLLTDEAATKEGIIGALGDQWLGKSAGPNDLIVLYISSHGSQSMQEAGGTNFLVAYDTDKDRLLSTGIPMQWLVQLIGEQVHCKRLLLLLDVCHSGSVAEGQKGLFRQNLDPKNLVIGQGQIVVCSSSSDQVSWESKEYPNSVFTKRLIEALNNKGGDSTLSEACLIMSDRVEEEVLRDRNAIQTPIVKRSWEGGGDLVLLDSSAQPFTSGATAREGDQ